MGVEWDIPGVEGLAIDGRVVYTGSSYANDANTLKAPAWTRFDAGVRYASRVAGHAVTWRANLQNVFDRQYWAGAFNDNFMTVGAPRTLLLSATVDF
ncbi:Ferrichrome receptor FcuA precursor [compost metagenome]